MSQVHTLSILCEDVDGIISRVSGMFTRRAFSILSISSGRTEVEGVNRITIVLEGEDQVIEQITKQLNKLINVIKVVELTPDSSVQRDHLLVKVRADAATRGQVVQAADLFRAHVVDVAPESLTLEATGTRDKLEAFLEMMEPYGVRELVRSGTLALARGPRSMTDRALAR